MNSIRLPYKPTRILELELNPNGFNETSFASLPETYELIKKIFSFINEAKDCKSLILSCRTFLKLTFEFCGMHIYTPTHLLSAIRVNNCETVRHFLYHLKVDLTFDNNQILNYLVDKYREMFVKIGKNPEEESLLNMIQMILEENKKPMQVIYIGHRLQLYTGNDNKNIIQEILDGEEAKVKELSRHLQLQIIDSGDRGSCLPIFIREKFGGLLSLLEKHPKLFTVTKVSSKSIISLNRNPADPLQEAFIHLTKKMLLRIIKPFKGNVLNKKKRDLE
jgi:hypothetical protein